MGTDGIEGSSRLPLAWDRLSLEVIVGSLCKLSVKRGLPATRYDIQIGRELVKRKISRWLTRKFDLLVGDIRSCPQVSPIYNTPPDQASEPLNKQRNVMHSSVF